jgi:hypothetical protein
MIQIQPVVFPLNLGTANSISVNISTNLSIPGARISYTLIDNTIIPLRYLSNGFVNLTEEQFTDHGNDKEWVENYVLDQLGVTKVVE